MLWQLGTDVVERFSANALLNWVFIFGKWGAPALGVGGAALASTLSAGLAALLMVGFLVHGPTRRRCRLVSRTNLKRRLIRPFLALAWPPAIQMAPLPGRSTTATGTSRPLRHSIPSPSPARPSPLASS